MIISNADNELEILYNTEETMIKQEYDTDGTLPANFRIDNNDFPSLDVFITEEKKGQTVATTFHDLPIDVIYHIEHVKSIKTKKQETSIILHLKDNQGKSLAVWGTSLIKKRMSGISIDNTKEKYYLRSKGIKSAKKSKNNYYDFQIISRKVKK